MISFTGKPGLNIGGLSFPQWDVSQLTSWITTVLVPWVNKRSGLVLISSTEVTSNVASVEFTEGINSDFDRYILRIDGLRPETDNTSLLLRVSEDAGANWEDDAADYRWTYVVSDESALFASNEDASDSEIQLDNVLGTGTGEVANLTVEFSVPSSSSVRKAFKIDSFGLSAVPTSRRNAGTGVYVGSSNAINGIQLFMSSDDIASGTFCLYGVRM